MSSSSVREIVKAKLATVSAWPIYDMSDSTISQLPSNKNEPWLGVQFVGGTERVDSIGGGNSADDPNPRNCWLEEGVFFVHVVTPTGYSGLNPLDEAEAIRQQFRGYRKEVSLTYKFWVESVDPPTDQAGAAIQIDGPWHGWSVAMDYQYHFFQ